MNKPYFLERWKIAKAQSEDRRDFEDIVNTKADEGGDNNGEQADDSSETE